ncbi:MAG: hypothetical protein ABI460_21350, partial [Caldimonas sp.]
ATLPGFERADGVIVEYLSNVTWDIDWIECPCPGVSITEAERKKRLSLGRNIDTYDASLPPMSRPTYITLEGVTGAFHAEREGLYQAASLALRTTTVSAKVEMEGMTVSHLDFVRWQPQIRGYGQSGDVAFWNESTRVMGLTEPPDFSLGTLYLTLRRDDGTLTTPVAVTPGPTASDVTLPGVPDFELVLDDGLRDRPMYVLGTLEDCDEDVKIAAISDGGKTDDGAQLFDITAVIDDDRVHARDTHLLPGPGDVQDPIDDGLDFDSGGGSRLLHLTNHTIVGNTSVGDVTATFTLRTDGTAGADVNDTGGYPVDYPSEWALFPIEPGVSTAYEVRATAAFGGITSGVVGVWMPITTDLSWSLTVLGGGVEVGFFETLLTIEMRQAGSTVVQVRRTITFLITGVP